MAKERHELQVDNRGFTLEARRDQGAIPAIPAMRSCVTRGAVRVAANPRRLTQHLMPMASALLGSLLCAWMGWLTSPAQAQNNDWATDWQQGDTADNCSPSCRSGFTCQGGECVPYCDPPCPDGSRCTSDGVCLQEHAPVVPPKATQPYQGHAQICQPACRRGFTCIEGLCVSACNPPCPANEMCSDQRECVPITDPTQAAGAGKSVVQVTPPETKLPPPTKPKKPEKKRDPSKDSVVNVHINALGPLQFGLTPTIEFGKIAAGYLRVRIPNTGLGSYLLLPGDAHTDFSWGIGAALGLHIFSAQLGNMRGFFAGVAMEYAFLENRDEERNFAAYRTHTLVPQIDIGYRWGLGSFLLGVGIAAGVAVPVYAEDVPLVYGGCINGCDDERDVHALVNVLVDVGFFL